jgi:uncharacterized protein YlxP (DUF503 family)
MLIAAALIELELHEAESIKAKRRVLQAVKARVERRFKVSIAEIADHDDRHSICLGCVKVGVDPVHLRAGMDKLIRFVESLGLAELVDEDVIVARIDEFEAVDADGEAEGTE